MMAAVGKVEITMTPDVAAIFEEAKRHRDEVYAQRDQLVAALSKVFPAHLVDATDAEPGWSTVVIVDLPTGQASWHLADHELPWFAHLERRPNDWDGHDDATKWARLAALTVPIVGPTYDGT
jgi:hypothetical protein